MDIFVEKSLFISILIFNIYICYVMLRFYNREKEKQKALEIISYITVLFINAWTINHIKVPIITGTINFILYIFLSCNYQSTLWRKIKASFFTLLLSSITEIVVAFIAGLSVNSSIDANIGTYYLYLSSLIVEYVTIIYLIYGRNQKSSKLDAFFKVYISLMLIVAFAYLIMIFQSENMPRQKILTGFLVLLYVFSSIIFLYTKILKEKKHLIKQRDHSVYKFETARNAAHMMAMQHSNLNCHIAVLKNMLDEYQIPDAIQYLSTMSETILVEESIHTGNSDLDRVLNLKIAEARQQGITVWPDIILAGQTKINGYVMANILGSLFDAIFDELKGTQSKTLYFYIDSSMGPIDMWFRHDDEIGPELRKKNKYLYRDTFKMERVKEEAEKHHGFLTVDINDQAVETFIQVIFK